MHRAAWEVWFYSPSGGRKLIDRFNTRGEAECHRARLGRLLGSPDWLTVCFDPAVVEAPPDPFPDQPSPRPSTIRAE